jgi:hypothetical protein
VGSSHNVVLADMILVALHYGATFALYAGFAELERALERRERTQCPVDDVVNMMWIGLAVVSMVTDVLSLVLAVRGPELVEIGGAMQDLVISLNALLLALTVADVAWLLALWTYVATECRGGFLAALGAVVGLDLAPPPPVETVASVWRL